MDKANLENSADYNQKKREEGEDGERRFYEKVILPFFPTAIRNGYENGKYVSPYTDECRKWDIKIPELNDLKIEVKTDYQRKTYNNLAVEAHSDRKPSGIYYTESIHWIFVDGDEDYFWHILLPDLGWCTFFSQYNPEWVFRVISADGTALSKAVGHNPNYPHIDKIQDLYYVPIEIIQYRALQYGRFSDFDINKLKKY